MNRLLVTGCTGFLGSALLERFLSSSDSEISAQKYKVVGICRALPLNPLPHVNYIGLGDLCNAIYSEALPQLLQCTDIVVHTAARVHIQNDISLNPLADFRTVNVEATLQLARLASENGVKRFIYISSIGVNGSSSVLGSPFSEESAPNPCNDYTQSKYEAEQGLIQISKDSGIEIVVIRPPLIYGPDAPGNFRSLVRAVYSGFPFPFGLVQNSRSFIFLGNLVDFIVCCGTNPRAANQTFLISDGYDLSTRELILKMSVELGVSPRLWNINYTVLKFLAYFLGRSHTFNKLCGNLQIDISKARVLLGWIPPYSVDIGLKLSLGKQFLQRANSNMKEL